MHDGIPELGVVAEWRGIVAKIGVFAEHVVAMLSNDTAKDGIVVKRSVVAELGVVPEHGVVADVVTKRAPSSVALLPRLALSPEHGLVITEHALSGVALLPRLALFPKRGVIVIVAAINNGVTMKQCFVGVGSASRGDSKREQVPPVKQ